MDQGQIVLTYQAVVLWAVPPLLAFALRYLQQIALKLGNISESLAVVVAKIDSHERRLNKLEDHRK